MASNFSITDTESSLVVSRGKNSCSRNIMAYRQKLCKAFLEKKPKKCPFCDHIRIPFRHESMAKLFVGRMNRSQREQQKRQKPPPTKRLVKPEWKTGGRGAGFGN